MSDFELNFATATADDSSSRKRKRSLWDRRQSKKTKVQVHERASLLGLRCFTELQARHLRLQAVKQKRQQPTAPRAPDLLKGYDLGGSSLQPKAQPAVQPSPPAAQTTREGRCVALRTPTVHETSSLDHQQHLSAG